MVLTGEPYKFPKGSTCRIDIDMGCYWFYSPLGTDLCMAFLGPVDTGDSVETNLEPFTGSGQKFYILERDIPFVDYVLNIEKLKTLMD
jgi:hypothetical protein